MMSCQNALNNVDHTASGERILQPTTSANPVVSSRELVFELSSFIGFPYCVALDVGDIDADGDTDVALSSNYGGDFVELNNGNEGFSTLPLYNGLAHRNDLALVDYDADGDLDFSWGNGGKEYNNGSFISTSNLDLPYSKAIAFADFNNDGYPDAVGANPSGGCSIAINQEGRGFQIGQILHGPQVYNYGVAAADIDNDGDIDISAGTKIWLNDGSGVFSDSLIDILVGESITAWDRDFADLNNDGYLDIVVGEVRHGSYVLLNDANGNFTWDGTRMTTSYGVATGDINKDGFMDIATSHPFHIYLNDKTGGFAEPDYVNPSYGVNAPSQDVEIADLNGDSYPDIILSDWKPEGFNGRATPKVFYQIVPTISVEIDIKPDDVPTTINLKSKGKIPVAIMSTESFDATSVAPETVVLGGSSIVAKKNGYMYSFEDVNHDGLLDLLSHVETVDIDPSAIRDGVIILTGETRNGEIIEGYEEITILHQ